MLLAGPVASGQTTPAATSWQKFPAVSVSPPPAPPAGSVPGSRVVVFTKPAGDVRPVQGLEEKRPADVKKAEVDKEVKKPLKPVDAAEANPFRLRTDEELVTEIVDVINRDRKRKYDADNKDYLENKPGASKPDLPKQLTGKDVPVIETTDHVPAPLVKAGYQPIKSVLEPSYVVHRRLYFEELNSDRYGWDLGFAQPFVSTLYFYKDVMLWPSHLMSNLSERFDTSAGKCPPGSPVAYYLYPPNITFRGGLWGAGAIVGVAALLP